MTPDNQPDKPDDQPASLRHPTADDVAPQKPRKSATLHYYFGKAAPYQNLGPGAHLRQNQAAIAKEFGLASIVHSGLIGPLEAHNLVAFGVVPRAFAADAQAVTRARGRVAAILYLAKNAGTATLDRSTLDALHAIMTKDLPAPRKRRTKSALASDAAIDEMLTTARSMESPVAASFFVLVQLLHLPPFPSEKEGLAIIAANIPLVRANLPPISFARTSPKRLAQAIRGVASYGRTERLQKLFMEACEEAGQLTRAEAQALRTQMFGLRGMGRPTRGNEVEQTFLDRYEELMAGIEVGAQLGDGEADPVMLRVLAEEEVPRKDRRKFVRAAVARVEAITRERTLQARKAS